MNNIPRELLEHHLRHALPLVHGRLLNAGCGERTYDNLYGPHVQSQIRFDWPNTIHDTRAIDVFGDVARLPFKDESFDTIWCTEVLEHVREPKLVLGEFYRVLKPQGVLILSTPFLYQVHEAPYDFFRYTYFGLSHLITQSGLSIRDGFARGGLVAVSIFFCRKLLHRIFSKLLGVKIAGLIPLKILDFIYLKIGGKSVRFVKAAKASYSLGYTVFAVKDK